MVLQRFYDSQICSIELINNGVIFYKSTGERFKYQNKIIIVSETSNFYYFLVDNKVRLVAYKYMPPAPWKQCIFLREVVQSGVEQGLMSYSKKHYGSI